MMCMSGGGGHHALPGAATGPLLHHHRRVRGPQPPHPRGKTFPKIDVIYCVNRYYVSYAPVDQSLLIRGAFPLPPTFFREGSYRI